MGVTNSHLSSHSTDVRNRLPEKNNFSKNIRIALYQHDRRSLQQLTGYDPSARQNNPKYAITSKNATEETIARRFVDLHPQFTAENLSVECFVELVEKRWDNETVQLFLSVGPSEEMLVTFLATCVIRNHYPALEVVLATLFRTIVKSGKYVEDTVKQPLPANASRYHDDDSMTTKSVPRFPQSFVKAHQIDHLFPIVCSQNDEGILVTFVEAGLYDTHNADASAAALRIVAHAAMRMHSRALQRYGNAILAPLPPVSGGPSGENAVVNANPNNAPDWFVDMLKATVAEGSASESVRVVGDGITAAPIGTSSAHGAASPSSSTHHAAPECDLTDEEIAGALLDPSSGALISVSDMMAPYVAPIVLILSTHAYPGRDVTDALKKEAMRSAVIKTKGMREVAGWQLYKKQRDALKAAESAQPSSSRTRHQQSAANNVEIKSIPLLSPVASILALADGPWTADTHRMHSPDYRRKVCTIFHVLTKKQSLGEDEINSVLAYLPEEKP